MGTCTSAEPAVAVSNEVASVESDLFRTTAGVKRDIEFVKKLTNRDSAIDHVPERSMRRHSALHWQRDQP